MSAEYQPTPHFHGELSDDKATLSIVQFRQIRGDPVQWHMALTAEEVVELQQVLEHFAPKMKRTG